jgi:hypothetical protein
LKIRCAVFVCVKLKPAKLTKRLTNAVTAVREIGSEYMNMRRKD